MPTHTQEYQKQLEGMHANPQWGSSSDIPNLAHKTIQTYKPASLLDFGAGKGKVSAALQAAYPDVAVTSYEPARGDVLPDAVDMTFSKDVLEHIEPDQLEFVLYDLHQRTATVHYHLIACHKAHHYLPDGRNCHLIVETPDWWQRLFRGLGYEILDEHVWGDIKHPAGKQSIATVKYECVLRGRNMKR